MEVENNVPYLGTEAAKVLRASVVDTMVEIANGKDVVRGKTKLQDATPMLEAPPPNTEQNMWAGTIVEWF